MDTHVDSRTYMKKLWVNLYVQSCTIPFASRYMTKLEERYLAPMCNNFLNTSHSLSSLLVCPFSRYRIPVSPWLSHTASGQTIMDTVIPSGPEVNISSSWRSKSQSRAIAITRHTIRCTLELILLLSSYRQIRLRTKCTFLHEATRYSHGLRNYIYDNISWYDL